VKKLAKHAPETPETALLLRRGCRACGCRHTNILAQNAADNREGETARSRPTGPGNLNEGTVNGLETTERSPIVSNNTWA
jgi:hypothetical protein